MPLDDDDVREILRLIDESDVEELRVETEGLSLYVRRGDAVVRAPSAPETPAEEAARRTGCSRSWPRCSASSTARPLPGRRRSSTSARASRRTTVVGLIEVMKMMNAVPAGVAGTIVEVCAENAEVVEYGAPLFRVEPDR